MGIFTYGDDEEDELFDLYMLNEIQKVVIKAEVQIILADA
jgi:hypothetical protein